MVTDRALRWIPHLSLKLEASLALDSATDVSEGFHVHRYAIDLRHRPLTRLHRVPAHRFLWFEWGNDYANDSFTRTSIAFSRRDTAAASARRECLKAHGLLAVDPISSRATEEPFPPSSGL